MRSCKILGIEVLICPDCRSQDVLRCGIWSRLTSHVSYVCAADLTDVLHHCPASGRLPARVGHVGDEGAGGREENHH